MAKGRKQIGRLNILPEGQIEDNDPIKVMGIDSNGDVVYADPGSVSDITRTSQLINDGEDGSSPFATEDYVNENVDFIFNNMHVPFGTNPIISPTPGQDELIREIGNRIYDDNTNQYIFVYSGSVNPYTGDNVYIYYATSPDGVTWTKQGKLVNSANEDPYLEIIGNQYRLYAEMKSPGNINDGIELFTGTSLTSLISQGLILVGDTGQWDDLDDSSPVPLFKEGKYYLFFEGRGTSNQAGAIGVATSNDGINYTKSINNPIIKGSQLGNNTWFTHLVPDDIIYLNNKWYITSHAYNGSNFVCGVFETNDLDSEEWYDTLNTWVTIDGTNDDISGNGLMLYIENRSIYAYNCPEGSEGIFEGILNVRSTDKLWFTSKLTSSISSGTALSPSSRNQIVDAPITGNRMFALKNDMSSKAGVYKLIYNRSAFTLSIAPESGVTINSSSSNLSIPAGRKLYMYLVDSNIWVAFLLPSDLDISNWDNIYNDRTKYLRNQSDGTVGNILGATTLTDANSLLTGMAWMIGSVANLPTSTSYHVIAVSGIAGYEAQLALRNNSFWFRTQENGTWQSWQQLASTAFADAKVANNLTASTTVAPSKTAVNTALALKADLASPALTGTPTAPTATPGTSTTQVATTAFVSAIGNNKVTKGGDSDASKLIIGTNNIQDFEMRRNGVERILIDGFQTTISESSLSAPSVLKIFHKTNGYTGDLLQAVQLTGGTPLLVAGIRPSGRVFGADATASNDFLTKGQYDAAKAIVDSALTTTQTASTLNTKYPSVPFPYVVFAPNVGSSMTYVKVNATQWMSYSGVLLS